MDYITSRIGNNLNIYKKLNFELFKEIIVTCGKNVKINNISPQIHLCHGRGYAYDSKLKYIFTDDFSVNDRCVLLKLMYDLNFDFNDSTSNAPLDIIYLDCLLYVNRKHDKFRNCIFDVYKTLCECGAIYYQNIHSLLDAYQYYLHGIVINQILKIYQK